MSHTSTTSNKTTSSKPRNWRHIFHVFILTDVQRDGLETKENMRAVMRWEPAVGPRWGREREWPADMRSRPVRRCPRVSALDITPSYLNEPPPGSFSLFFWFPESWMVMPAGPLPVWMADGFPKVPNKKRQNNIIIKWFAFCPLHLYKENKAYFGNMSFYLIYFVMWNYYQDVLEIYLILISVILFHRSYSIWCKCCILSKLFLST